MRPFFKFFYKRITIISVLFVLVTPLLYFSMKPMDDLRYHMNRNAVKSVTAQTFPDVRENDFVSLEGRIDPRFVYAYSKDIFDMSPVYFVKLNGYPDNLMIQLYSGELWEIFNDYAKSKSYASFDMQYNNMRLIKVNLSRAYETITDANKKIVLFAKTLSNPVKIEGRVYSSNGMFFPFERYMKHSSLGYANYFSAMKIKTAFQPEYLKYGKASDTASAADMPVNEDMKTDIVKKEEIILTQAFLLNGGETPDKKWLLRNNFIIFFAPFVLLLLPILFFLFEILFIALRLRITGRMDDFIKEYDRLRGYRP